MICTDCKLVGGDSGGPLFNMRGEVIGIHSRHRAVDQPQFPRPAAAFRTDWDRLLASELWERPIRLRQRRQPPRVGSDGRADAGGRCVITVVTDGLPAAKAGVKVGDVVTAINDRKISTFNELRNIVALKRPGDWLTLHVERGDETLELAHCSSCDATAVRRRTIGRRMTSEGACGIRIADCSMDC